MSWPRPLIELNSSLVAIAPYGGPIGKNVEVFVVQLALNVLKQPYVVNFFGESKGLGKIKYMGFWFSGL